MVGVLPILIVQSNVSSIACPSSEGNRVFIKQSLKVLLHECDVSCKLQQILKLKINSQVAKRVLHVQQLANFVESCSKKQNPSNVFCNLQHGKNNKIASCYGVLYTMRFFLQLATFSDLFQDARKIASCNSTFIKIPKIS